MKDFNCVKLLKDLNQKFYLDIGDTEVTKINLSCKNREICISKIFIS